jgi:geranylgeranyl reductase family protein
MHDVIVVGGGPIGSHTACLLARQGFEVVVLEKEGRAGHKRCCTGIIGQEPVHAFDIDARVILRRVKSGRLFSPTGKALYIKRDEYQASILDRAAFDLAMARKAQDAGVQYLFNRTVNDIEVKDGVYVHCQEEGSDLSAKAVVIASGCGTRLTGKLGLGEISDFVGGAQVEVAVEGQDEVEVYFGREIAPGFFGWFVPTTIGDARVGLLSRRAPYEYLKRLLERLTAEGKIVPDEWTPSYGAVPLRPLRRTYGARVLAVGDAAGQVKPTTGGGIYYGLLCADIAAGTLSNALRQNDLSAKNLSRYEREWKRKIGRELTLGYWARKLYERLSDKQIDRLFDVVKNNRIDEALLEARDVSFDWHSRAIVKLLGRAVVSRVLGGVKLPSRGSKDI